MKELFRELKTLLGHAKENRRKRFYLLSIIMMAVALAEAINLGLVLPFVGLLISQDNTTNAFYGQDVVPVLSSLIGLSPMLAMVLAFSFVTLIAGALRALQLYLSVRLAFDFGADLSAQIYRQVLSQPYTAHLSRNSSEVVSGILGHVNQVISWVLQPLLTLLSSLLLFLAIVVGLFFIGKSYALVSVLAFVFVYAAIVFAFRNRMRKNSDIIDKTQTKLVRCLQEGIGGLREIILNRTHNQFAEIFVQADRQLREASSNSIFWGGIPRIFVETLGICIIVVVAYSLDRSIQNSNLMIQIIATITLGAQRALPALQQIYSSWTSVAGSESTLRTVNRLLGKSLEDLKVSPKQDIPKIEFKQSVKLRDISFAYEPQPPILKNINIQIVPGQTIGIFGTSGTGKSTLLDVLMGLLPPSGGTIEVDGAVLSTTSFSEWQSLIGHVPQSIFLLDSSIAENISFGISNEAVDKDRVMKCAELARVSDFIELHRGGIDSVCGERGIRLSGGQRQRIGIARALYRQPSILILDEATNSLEPQMEQEILRSIKEQFRNLTIIMVAHRQTSFAICDQVYELSNGHITKIQ